MKTHSNENWMLSISFARIQDARIINPYISIQHKSMIWVCILFVRTSKSEYGNTYAIDSNVYGDLDGSNSGCAIHTHNKRVVLRIAVLAVKFRLFRALECICETVTRKAILFRAAQGSVHGFVAALQTTKNCGRSVVLATVSSFTFHQRHTHLSTKYPNPFKLFRNAIKKSERIHPCHECYIWEESMAFGIFVFCVKSVFEQMWMNEPKAMAVALANWSFRQACKSRRWWDFQQLYPCRLLA